MKMYRVMIKTFSDIEYANNFLQKGEMLFRHVNYFRKIEDGHLRGDTNEGNSRAYYNMNIPQNIETINFHSQITGKTVPFNWKEYQEEYPELKGKTDIRIQMDYVAEIQIYCMTYLVNGMRNIDAVISEIKRFGKYSVVIADENLREFLENVKKCKENIAGNIVKYDDNPDKPSPFIKPKRYANQSEYRVIRYAHDKMQSFYYAGPVKGTIWSTKSIHGIKRYL